MGFRIELDQLQSSLPLRERIENTPFCALIGLIVRSLDTLSSSVYKSNNYSIQKYPHFWVLIYVFSATTRNSVTLWISSFFSSFYQTIKRTIIFFHHQKSIPNHEMCRFIPNFIIFFYLTSEDLIRFLL